MNAILNLAGAALLAAVVALPGAAPAERPAILIRRILIPGLIMNPETGRIPAGFPLPPVVASDELQRAGRENGT